MLEKLDGHLEENAETSRILNRHIENVQQDVQFTNAKAIDFVLFLSESCLGSSEKERGRNRTASAEACRKRRGEKRDFVFVLVCRR